MKKMEALELTRKWKTLNFEMKKNKKVDLSLFCDVFSQTYGLLSRCATENSVHKECVGLIAAAYLFANADSNELDSECLATLVLTERMLTDCAFRTYPTVPEGSEIYILEARRDVYVDFNNPGESVAILEKAFDERFWNSL